MNQMARAERPQRARRGVPWPVVAAGFVLTLAIALAAGAYVFFVLMHYEPVAARHLPRGMARAARLSVEQVAVLDLVRKEIVPALESRLAASSPSPAPPGEEGILTTIARDTGIELARDLRELVVAESESGAAWVIVCGGRFPRGKVVAGVVRALATRGHRWTYDATVGIALGPGAVALGQAADGAIVLAANRELLAASLPASDASELLGLPMAPAGGLVLVQPAATGGTGAEPGWRGVRRVRASLELGGPHELLVDLDFRGPPPTEAEAEATARDLAEGGVFVVEVTGGRTVPAPAGWAQARPSRETKSSSTPGSSTPGNTRGGTVTLLVPWEHAEMASAARAVADALRAGPTPAR